MFHSNALYNKHLYAYALIYIYMLYNMHMEINNSLIFLIRYFAQINPSLWKPFNNNLQKTITFRKQCLYCLVG